MQTGIAQWDELPQLVNLLGLLFSQEEEFAANADKQEAGLRLIMENSSIGTILVLRQDEGVVGMVNLLYTVSTFLGSKVAILEDMIIHPDHRGHGAGSLLLSAAVHHAKQQDCQRITLLTDSANQPAIGFYNKHGFTRSPMIPLRKMIPLPNSPMDSGILPASGEKH